MEKTNWEKILASRLKEHENEKIGTVNKIIDAKKEAIGRIKLFK